jgi:dsDNA-specific endonuclease/ATPase MutS2
MASMKENAAIVISAARQMRAIIELAEQIGEIDEVAAKKQAMADEYNGFIGKLMDVKKELAAATADTQAAKDEALKLRKEAKDEAKKIKSNAEAQASAKLNEAEAKAAALVENAKKEAFSWDERVIAARDEFEKRSAEIAELDKQMISTKAKVEKLLKGLQDGNV